MKNRRLEKTRQHSPYSLIVAGFGGQGVLMIGNLLAYAAMLEGKHVSYLPFYGVEMRGGIANCTVVISSEQIGSPVVSQASCVIAMDPSSFEKYKSRVANGGLLIANSSLIDIKQKTRTDIELLAVPVNDIARDHGMAKLLNMVALGVHLEKTKLVKMDSLVGALEKVIGQRYASLIPSNIEALKKGMEFVRSRG